MQKWFLLLMLISLTLIGCASDPGKTDIREDSSLIQIPIDQQEQLKPDTGDSIGFEDISLSDKRRLLVLTNRMEINKQTDNFINKGQVDVITRPDGTILYPYGLAPVNLTAKRMMYSKIILQEGEKIMSAAAGDTTRWNILPNYIGDPSSYTPVVLVKPFMGGLQTSLSIITNKRDYDITIQSVDSGDYMPVSGFIILRTRQMLLMWDCLRIKLKATRASNLKLILKILNMITESGEIRISVGIRRVFLKTVIKCYQDV